MHALTATQFLTTLSLSIVTTLLVSRVILLSLRARSMGMRKVAIANCASFAISYALFVVWCSTPERIYWSAGHVAFAPQALLFMYDILTWSGDESAIDDQQESDS